jgi:hypothetical protein
MLATACTTGQGTRIRARIHPGMSLAEVFETAAGWLFCWEYPDARPAPDARVRVSATVLAIDGFGQADGRFEYASRGEMLGALAT